MALFLFCTIISGPVTLMMCMDLIPVISIAQTLHTETRLKNWMWKVDMVETLDKHCLAMILKTT